MLAIGADMGGSAVALRYHGDDDPGVRLLTETLVAEMIAATWWNHPGNTY